VTQTTDHPKPSPDALWATLTPAEQSYDYIRRIHWWVRLFGIVWVVIPVVASLAAVAFGLGILSKSAADNTMSVPTPAESYAKCLLDGFKATECDRWYPD
jgi:hypothetical protein